MDADVVVVGAGALGLSTALHLALLGRHVVVVERGTAGGQASGRAAGLFKSIQADEVRTAIARRSIERALAFQTWAGVPLAVERSGSVNVARTGEHAALLRREVAASHGWGVPVEELDTSGIRSRTSLYVPTGAEHAWWCPEDVYIEEPMTLVDAYVAAARSKGVEVREREDVVGIESPGGAVAAVVTDRDRIETGHVVDAAGAWTRPVAALAGGWVPVVPVRHQLAITEPTGAVDLRDPIVRIIDAAVYLRPARGGLMLGGFEPDPLAVTSPEVADPILDIDVLTHLAGSVASAVPAADLSRLADHRGGMFTMSPDGRFLAGAVPGVNGLWVASGCNGSGFSSSLGLGEALAALITGAHPYVDLSSLAPHRLEPRDDETLVTDGCWQYAHYYDPAQ